MSMNVPARVNTEVSVGPREVKRGDVWYAQLDNYGDSSLQAGARPIAICQSEYGLDSHLLLAAPVSAAEKHDYPFLQEIILKKTSQIHYEHMRPVHRSKLQRFICRLDKEQRREMDIRASVPTGLDKCNYLHVNQIKVENRFWSKGHNDYLFEGKLHMLFGYRSFRFTSKEFCVVFPGHSSILRDDLMSISSFLETLSGLKFIYDVSE